jgi:hypothetical protein
MKEPDVSNAAELTRLMRSAGSIFSTVCRTDGSAWATVSTVGICPFPIGQPPEGSRRVGRPIPK